MKAGAKTGVVHSDTRSNEGDLHLAVRTEEGALP